MTLSIVGLFVFVSLTLIICYAIWKGCRRAADLKKKVAERIERTAEIKGDPEIEEQFRPLVEIARARFPDCRVWGQFIQNGTGYGIFVANQHKKSCFQVLSQILINGKPERVDIRTIKNPEEAIQQAFDAVEKSLKVDAHDG